MGNCCAKAKDNSVPVPPTEYFFIYCEDPVRTSSVKYEEDKPLQHYLESLSYSASEYMLYKGSLEILDSSIPLRSLCISPGDTVKLIPIPRVEEKPMDPPSILVHSLEEIAEEETTNKREIEGKIPVQPGRLYNNQSNKTASSLWRTAMQAYKQPSALRYNPADSSVFSNYTLDYSLKEKALPLNLPVNFKRQSFTVDSDDSYFADGNSRNHRTDLALHPTDYFKDIQGPFSILKQF